MTHPDQRDEPVTFTDKRRIDPETGEVREGVAGAAPAGVAPAAPAVEDKVAELTADLQRVQADFANYRKRREEADVRNQAESLVYQTEKFVSEQRSAEGGSKVPEEALAKIDTAIAEAKTALEGSDIGAIKSAMEKLGEESQALGQAIYEAAQAEQAASGGGAAGGSGADDVVDAEVVEEDQESKCVSRTATAIATNR